MTAKTNFITLTYLLFSIGLMFSCQEDDSTLAELQKEPLDAKMVELLSKKGFDAKDIYVEDGFYYVKGVDMVFDKKMAENFNIEQPAEEQRWNGGWMYYSYTRDVKIYKDASFPNHLYGGPLYYAAKHWSNISPNINISFTNIRSQADIVVSGYYNSNATAWAYAAFPHGNGNVGSWMWINTYHRHNQSYGDKVGLMVHELGHNLGYWHTNQPGAYHIPGTPYTDYNSIMHPNIPSGWQYNIAAWTSGDREMIRWAYGLY